LSLSFFRCFVARHQSHSEAPFPHPRTTVPVTSVEMPPA
jgi:hypothetical protein